MGALFTWCAALAAYPQGYGPQMLIPQPISVIEAGTVIDGGPPERWSHLVILNRSRIGAGDIDEVGPLVKRLASFLFSATVANVESEQVDGQIRYRLADVAAGIGTKINGKDTIISSDTQERLGANLGLFERMGLSRAEARLADLLVVARTDTMAIIDGRTQILRDQKHQEVIARDAVLVDADTGHLETLVWFVGINRLGHYTGVASDFDRLPPDLVEELILHVDAGEFVFGMITEKALAAIPPRPEGRRSVIMPEDLKALAGEQRFSFAQAAEFEKRLWKLLKQLDAK